VPPYRETQIYVARVIREFNRRKQWERLHQDARRIDHNSARETTHASQTSAQTAAPVAAARSSMPASQ
jgi:hypothetical protein